MKTTRRGTCPLCHRSGLKLVTRSDGRTTLPTHGHLIATNEHLRQAPSCKASGFSTQGVEIIEAVIAAFVAMKAMPRTAPKLPTIKQAIVTALAKRIVASTASNIAISIARPGSVGLVARACDELVEAGILALGAPVGGACAGKVRTYLAA